MSVQTGPKGKWIDPYIRAESNLRFLKRLRPESVDLVITSPPYNTGKDYEDRQTLDVYLRAQAKVLGGVLRVLKSRGSVCWQVGNFVDNGCVAPIDTLLYPAFVERGLLLRNRIIWHYGHGLHCKRRLSGRYETINWWTRGDDYTWNLDAIRVPSKYPGKRYYKGPRKGQLSGNPLGKNPSDYWVVCDVRDEMLKPAWSIPNVKHNHVEKEQHPCQFPVELAERLVLALSNPGDTVLDPYMGSGSTVIAAAKHHRRGMGCDVKQEYVVIARDRIRRLKRGSLRTRPIGSSLTPG